MCEVDQTSAPLLAEEIEQLRETVQVEADGVMGFDSFFKVRDLCLRHGLRSFEQESYGFDEKMLALYRSKDTVGFTQVKSEREEALAAAIEKITE